MKPEEMLVELHPLLGEKARKLHLAWMLADEDERDELERVIRTLYVKHLRPSLEQPRVLLPPPPAAISDGEVTLGSVLYNGVPRHEFSLQESELAQHVGIFGRTGSGKTNTVRVLLRELLRQKLPVLVFDWKKDYSELDFPRVFGVPKDQIMVLPVGKRTETGLWLNPLIPPPGTSAEVWVKQLCEVLTHAYCGGPGFESIFLKAIDASYREKGIYEGSTNYPTFRDVRRQLQKLPCSGREAQWMQSALRTINAICYGGMDDTVNSASPMSVAELLSRNIILELDVLSNADKTLLVETILLWLHNYKLSQPPTKRVENIIIVEEAHHLLRRTAGTSESLIETCLREMRSLGIGLVIVDQMPSLISKVALANTYCTIALNVKTGQDVSALAQAMLLEPEQKPVLGMLPVGEAVVKLQGRHMKPFHVRVPLLDGCERRVRNYPAGPPRIPRQEAAPEVEDVQQEGVPSKVSVVAESRKPQDEELLLVDILQHPTDSVTARYSRLGLSARKGNAYREELISSGLVVPVTFAGQNAWLRLFQISPAGVARLKDLGYSGTSAREGGLEHRYWQDKMAEHYLRQGYRVEKEKNVNGHIVDLVATKGKEKIAIEVETGKSDYLGNIKKCLEEKSFTQVVVVCTSKAAEEKVLRETTPWTPSKVKVVVPRVMCD